MDLWIRSQDKQMLTKVDYLYLEVNDKREILGGNSYMFNKSLGIYNSKERALEILNEIQNWIKVPDYNMTECYEKIDLYIKALAVSQIIKIYEMPEE